MYCGMKSVVMTPQQLLIVSAIPRRVSCMCARSQCSRGEKDVHVAGPGNRDLTSSAKKPVRVSRQSHACMAATFDNRQVQERACTCDDVDFLEH